MTTAPRDLDVLVAGGGAAGLAAAIGAARQGASVGIIERYGFLGGMATAACVGTVCGLFLRQPGHSPTYAMGGFPQEFGRALERRCGMPPVCWREGLHFLPYRPMDFANLADELLAQHGVHVWLHTTLSSVTMENDRLAQIKGLAWDRPLSLAPRTIIDCTGEATVSALAGLPVREEQAYQAASIVFQLEDLKACDTRQLSLALLRDLKRGIQAQELPESDIRLSIVPGSHLRQHALFKLTLAGQVAASPNRLTELEQQARLAIGRVTRYLRAASPPFQQARLSWIAPQVGLRTGRRPIGMETLTETAVLTTAKPATGITVAPWPIERWTTDPTPQMRYFAEGDYYTIPAGALRSATAENLYFAGRNISADEVAIASARVIGTCLGTGYAAGVLASRRAPESQLVESLRHEMNIP